MTPGYIGVALRARLRVEAGDRCGYCQTPQTLAYGPLEVDHIVPVAAGGSDDVDNLWLACRPCNQYKGVQGLCPGSTKWSPGSLVQPTSASLAPPLRLERRWRLHQWA